VVEAVGGRRGRPGRHDQNLHHRRKLVELPAEAATPGEPVRVERVVIGRAARRPLLVEHVDRASTEVDGPLERQDIDQCPVRAVTAGGVHRERLRQRDRGPNGGQQRTGIDPPLGSRRRGRRAGGHAVERHDQLVEP